MESQKGLSEEVTLELKLQDEVCGISVLAGGTESAKAQRWE